MRFGGIDDRLVNADRIDDRDTRGRTGGIVIGDTSVVRRIPRALIGGVEDRV